MTDATPVPTSTANAPHYRWGDACDGWRLLDENDLAVIEERVPAGVGEVRHYHRRARQFFYILRGSARMELPDACVPLGPGQGLQVPPGVPHRFVNTSCDDVVFLVISAPPTSADRIEVGDTAADGAPTSLHDL